MLRADGSEESELALGIGAGYYWVVGWHPQLLSYVGACAEEWPFMDDPDFPADDEADRDRTVLMVGDEPLYILNVDELEQAMGVDQLPDEIRAKLERDRREHFAGRWGESVEEIRERMRRFGKGAELSEVLNE